MKSNTIKFVLAPGKRLTGALLQNREVFKYLKNKGLKVEKMVPRTCYYYSLPSVGVLLNYFTLYSQRKRSGYYFANLISSAPFLKDDTKLITIFHSLDSVAAEKVMNTLMTEDHIDRKNRRAFISQVKDKVIPVGFEIETQQKINNVIEEACLKKAEAAICVSPLIKREIKNKYGDLPKGGVHVILNGVPDYFFKKRKIDSRINQDKINLLYISRIVNKEYMIYVKGIDRALGIFSKKFKNLNKLFFGHFPKEDEETINFWKSLLAKNSVNLISNLSRREVASCLRKADIFIQTSRTEACQLTLLESMASGLVPVSYSVGVAPLFIKNGKNGFIVRSITEAVDKINYLIKHPDLREKMADECIKIANKNFRYQRMMDEYYDFFKKLK